MYCGLTNHVFAFIQMTHVVECTEGQLKHFILNVCKVRFKPLVLPFSQNLQDEYALVTPIFQDDNSTVLRTGRTGGRFDEHSHTPSNLDWPVKSPDPIENLWGMLEQRVKRRNQHPRNLLDLRSQILRDPNST
ncbi:hypothetical protein AVEN_177063-1 [Araneus ventricosus]|uniref:Tc1-like transposase DDE domain-containing protein n=1 Tax=Araneus ventricosus TaxID=182803 RepID=A0A4Y2CUZ3_ARAVE|nr:hypothetical protein AVEN_177063-1 [Araneus ventricosus]